MRILFFLLTLLLVNTTFGQSRSTLRKMVRYDDTTKLKELLAEGFDVNEPYRERALDTKYRLLDYAIHFQSLELAKYLLGLPETDFQYFHKNGTSPLHQVAINGWHDLAMQMIDSGALINPSDKDNMSVLRVALAQLSWPSYVIPHAKTLEFIKFLYAHNIDPQQAIDCCKKKTTVLILGAHSTNLEAIEFLYSKHPNTINSTDYKGNTALHYAVENGEVGIVKFLVSKGADPSITNNKGKTVLDFTMKKGNEEIIEILKP
jgi:ankyrin repeat protein